SMFGFQRIGDLMWLAGDQQARGFLVGGTSGRTTLNGEGLHGPPEFCQRFPTGIAMLRATGIFEIGNAARQLFAIINGLIQ
ncbi:hypothetical protein HZD82_24360, partial [Pantoea agglomerans]|uniref:hypothetical protein n=1 Tax=Enterobacter agglomerans TaxID=549 RepID=UPI001A8D6539|nr:hypothetical protein [Pantoea agglomerans]